MEYCEKNMYVREALLANPHKYGEGDKAPLREHIAKCEVCQASVDEAREFAESMGWDFNY
jgi:hypothetical protein